MAITAAILVLAALPAIVSAVAGPRDLARMGTFWFVHDFSQYQAAMREGSESTSWLIHDRFTAEPHAPVLMYPFYVALGKLGAAAGISSLGLFSAAEWLGRVSVVLSLYVFTATFIAGRVRRTALLLAISTLGLAGLALPARLILDGVGATGLTAFLPSTLNIYLEISSFGVFLAAPHLMLGLAGTLLVAPLYLRAQHDRWKWSLVLAVDVLALSLIHPFNLPVIVSILTIDSGARFVGSAGRDRWRALVPLAGAALAAAPMGLYNAYLFAADPFWSLTYGAQNTMPSPAPWSLPGDFGIVLLAAPAAWTALRRWPADRRRLMLLWVGMGLLWMYAPVPYQRRFAFGLQPALAVLSAVGISHIALSMARSHWPGVARKAVGYVVLAAVLVTPVLVYVSLISSAITNSPAEVYQWTRAEADAGNWLASNTSSQDVVLASTEFANPLVGVFDGRVVHGHIVATFDSPRKEALVHRFYSADSDAAERSAILAQTGATIVALGPHEEALGCSSLADQPRLTQVYDSDGVRLYRVAPPVSS